MKVIWSDFAIRIIKEIQHWKFLLHQGLKKLNQNHRYLVNGNYKIIYKPVKEGVLITDIFDTRQNPTKINNLNR